MDDFHTDGTIAQRLLWCFGVCDGERQRRVIVVRFCGNKLERESLCMVANVEEGRTRFGRKNVAPRRC